ncbi:MAG: type IV pilin protein [Gammaproteobacteria bacterium]
MTEWRRSRAFTLLELLIVVAVIGVLTLLAIPAYEGYLVRVHRSVAVTTMLDIANRQTQFHLDNKTYTDKLTHLGFSDALVSDTANGSALAFDARQSPVATTAAERVYLIRIDSAQAHSFTLSAIPQRRQSLDAECGTYTLKQTGARANSGTGSAADCW